MECNKDEASKAKVISEQKLTKNDFAGANKFALKAQALYPGMDGLSQLMTTINVCVSAEKKVGQRSEVDWYGVLGVTPTADDKTIKKQYRKIALMVHPDKNNCSRADGAFKLVSEAWNLLSNKAKRCAYDQRRTSNVLNSNMSAHSNKSSSSSSVNTARSHPSNLRPQVACKICHTPYDTFVAKCKYCNRPQEHLNRYQKTTIICIHCQRHFLAELYIYKLCCLGEPTPMSSEALIGNTFLTTCQECHKPQEHLKIHMDKIVICSHCQKPFKVPTVENDDSVEKKVDHEAASKAKVISEQKLREGDFFSAKEFTTKAQALYPGMYGLSQLMATIDVYVSAQKKVGSCFEVDWYRLLGVTPTADDETIMKQYRKIALMVHPGKNFCPRADHAYRLVLKAWSLLSNKAKREEYDKRRTSYVLSINTSTNNIGSSSNTTVPPQAICQVCHTSHDTFVAQCKYCETPQEHLNRYENTAIICIYCQRHFWAASVKFKLCSPGPPNAMTYNTFLTTCKKCHTPQEHLKVHLDKIVMCSNCRNPMKVATAENDVHEQAHIVGIKRPREEAQGAVGGWERRENVCTESCQNLLF